MLESWKVLMQVTSNWTRLRGSSGMISTVRSSTMRLKFLVAWQRLLRACSKVWPLRSVAVGDVAEIGVEDDVDPGRLAQGQEDRAQAGLERDLDLERPRPWPAA